MTVKAPYLFLLMVLSGYPFSALAQHSGGDLIVPSAHEMVSPKTGYCKGDRGIVDLDENFYLKNQTLEYRVEGVVKKINISAESVVIGSANKAGEVVSSKVYEVDRMASPEKNIDIELTLVLTPNYKLGVFWKETFQHQSYKQGIFLIKNDELQNFCSGKGGVDTTH